MKNILVMGAAGQIGSELVPAMRKIYGNSNVIASDIRTDVSEVLKEGPFEIVDCLDITKIKDVIAKYKIDTVYNLVALLSAVGEQNPQLSWKINIGGLMNLLELAHELKFALFTPSSIGAFGLSTPHDNTPQDTIQRPNSMYGVTKVSGELLCDYYHQKYGIDTRGVRYPGIISNVTPPGGGTTDYAVDIYYKAIQEKKFTCNLKPGTYLDMMYMPDCIRAGIEIMEADPSKLIHRNAFNVAAMSFEPEMIAAEIRKYIPEFVINYDIDEVRQAIAESWPNKMDDTCAHEEWGWKHEYDLPEMTEDMLNVLQEKLKI
ncbi:MAG: L-threonine 3-dehydrogenase [Candidatus Cloacimonetes bacterium]|nr:L-threonine 3-dehydrogenase [Candidatus Cloacimonadota bacterium]MBL7148981.1 L-threonine 3-dehydrogenase [Candidatus Cloacimonadota bacterium]